MLCAVRHPSEAKVKMIEAPSKTGLRPYLSDSGPITICNTAVTAR